MNTVFKYALIATGLYVVYLAVFTMLYVVIVLFGKFIAIFFFVALGVLTFGHYNCGRRIRNTFSNFTIPNFGFAK